MSANQKDNFFLSLFIKLWKENNYGLFDYESELETFRKSQANLIIEESVYIRRKKKTNEIMKLRDPANLFPDEVILFRVKHEEKNKYILENKIPVKTQNTQKIIDELNNKVWYILKHDPIKSNKSELIITNTNDDYFLCKNDVIKLGRIKYTISEINITSKGNDIGHAPPLNDKTKYDINGLNKKTELPFEIHYDPKDSSEYKNLPKDDIKCKICLGEESDRENDPLVNLCKCKGSVSFSHFLCIKKWMESKCTVKGNCKKTVKNFIITSFNCEICKTPYPVQFKLSGIEKPFELIDLKIPLGCDYIILESLDQMKDNHNFKMVHVVQLDKDDLIIGRSNESDIRIDDISISRNHAILKYDKEKGTILIRDLKSKFGTLVLIKKPLEIKERKIHIQIGGNYVEARLISMEEYNKLEEERKKKLYG